MTRLLSSLPVPLRAAIVAFSVTLAVTLGIACFATLSLAPLTSTLPPAIVARLVCIVLAILAACAAFDTARGLRE